MIVDRSKVARLGVPIATILVLIAYLACSHEHRCYPGPESYQQECRDFSGIERLSHWWGGFSIAPEAWTAIFTFVLSAFTLGLWISTWLLWKESKSTTDNLKNMVIRMDLHSGLAEQQKADSRAIQRAYIRLGESEEHPIELGNVGSFFVSIKITNSGATPARITAISMSCIVQDSRKELPEAPPYAEPFDINVFLPTQDFFVHQRRLEYSDQVLKSKTALDAINAMNDTLCIFGYVDYTDVFGTNHRGGFAREYFPPRPQGSGKAYLTFVVKKGYSYDKERT
jgi:hypothetical protein